MLCHFGSTLSRFHVPQVMRGSTRPPGRQAYGRRLRFGGVADGIAVYPVGGVRVAGDSVSSKFRVLSILKLDQADLVTFSAA